MPMTTEGHTQFKGWRYCPKENPLSKEQWLTEKRAEKKKPQEKEQQEKEQQEGLG